MVYVYSDEELVHEYHDLIAIILTKKIFGLICHKVEVSRNKLAWGKIHSKT